MLKHSLVRSVAVCGLMLAGLAIPGHSQESPGFNNGVGTGGYNNGVGTGLSRQNVDKTGPAGPKQTLIYSLRNHPATMVAETIAMAMEKESGLTIVPDQLSNVLVICGTADTLKECQEILKEIDQPRRMIHFEVVISVADSRTTADEKNKPGSTDRIKFKILDGNLARFHSGQQVAVATGTAPAVKEPVKTYQIQQVGTMFNLTPRIAGEEIAVDLEFEKSWLVQSARDDAADEAIPAINTLKGESTVSLKPGVALNVFGSVSQGTHAAENVSITITASFDEAKEH